VPDSYTAQLGGEYLNKLGDMDLIVRAPGIRPDAILAANPMFPGLANRITSATREFLKHCPATVIGVTGTKGKGTTSSLIARMVEATGKRVWLGGNIGRSPLDFLAEVKPDDVVVLELSSFQLMDCRRSPQIAVCLMIAPEHLNWHTDMAEYVDAKSNLFRYQSEDGLAIFKTGDRQSAKIAKVSPGRKVGYGAAPGAEVVGDKIMIDGIAICRTDQVALPGPHNLENICAAITAVWELIDRRPEPIRAVVTSFAGLEHRLEFVAEVDGVKYYDDSFATTPETAIAAIRSFPQSKVMILGGSDKGARYDELAKVVENEGVIHTLLIGDTAPKLEAALRKAGFTHLTAGLTDMRKMVETCYHITEPGDVVLLSPACASFGLFKNYKDRGEQFKTCVQELAIRAGQRKPEAV
jgi:UDP-N-acetylmuramoylalanine--D-glutamate ligase